MIDTHDIRRDPRRLAAMETDNGSSRGWDFRPSDEPPIWLRAIAEVLRPRSIIILLALAGCVSLFWIT
jgi:hypothetical protein